MCESNRIDKDWLAQCQDIASVWDIPSWCWQSGITVVQHYKIDMKCTTSPISTRPGVTFVVARPQNDNDKKSKLLVEWGFTTGSRWGIGEKEELTGSAIHCGDFVNLPTYFPLEAPALLDLDWRARDLVTS